MVNFSMFGGRTFLLTVGCGVVSSFMRWFDKIDNGSWTAVILASVCAYIAKAGFDKHTDAKADVAKKAIEAETAPAPLGDR